MFFDVDSRDEMCIMFGVCRYDFVPPVGILRMVSGKGASFMARFIRRLVGAHCVSPSFSLYFLRYLMFIWFFLAGSELFSGLAVASRRLCICANEIDGETLFLFL